MYRRLNETNYHLISGFFQKSRNFYPKHILCNSINRISYLFLTSAILCAWCNSCETSKMKIFRLQKRACRVILDYNVGNTVSKDFNCL